MGPAQEAASSSSLHPLTTSPARPNVSSSFLKPNSMDSMEVEELPSRDENESVPRYGRVLRATSTSFPALHRAVSRVVTYLRGPRPKVFLPAPTPLLHLIPPRLSLETRFSVLTKRLTSPVILGVFVVTYIISLSFLTRANSFLTPAESFINCLSTYWLPNDGCGVDGQLCQPFSNSSFDFRCPAQCASVILLNPRAVGTDEVEFVPLVVGGGDSQPDGSGTYRGDSFICAAAIHAGIISNSKGGCGTINLVGTFAGFESSSANGITSTAFPGQFPLSFTLTESDNHAHCTDLRNDGLAFNITVTILLFLFLRPKPVVLFWCLVCIGYWHITFFSDPRNTPPPISDALGDFLPLLFVAYAMWLVAYRHVLPAFSAAPIECMVLYLPFYWLGVLFNWTTSKIPVDRLIASDIRKRPGALTALIIISAVVAVLVMNQVRVMRNTGWLPFYLWRYALVGAILLVLSQMPGLIFRLHHYFAAMLILPLTAFPTRLSLVYQAFCLGMFLDGVGRFSFASIFQTAAELQRDAPLGTSLPVFLTNSTTYNASIPLASQNLLWGPFPDTGEGWNGYSLLIDDVERYAGTAMNFTLAALNASLPHFFRLAFQKDSVSGDYTQAATLSPNGTWIDPAPGPS